VNEALTTYSGYLERLIAFGVIDPKTWRLSWANVSKLRWYFKTPDAKPLATKAEILADQKKASEDRERWARENQATNARVKRDVERKMRIDDLLKLMAVMFWSYEGLDSNAEELGERWRENSWNRQAFRKFQREVVEQLTDAGKTDAEIIQEMTAMTMIFVPRGPGTPWGSTIPEPLKEGETRHFIEPLGLAGFINGLVSENDLTKTEITTCLGMDGRFVVTVGPKDRA